MVIRKSLTLCKRHTGEDIVKITVYSHMFVTYYVLGITEENGIEIIISKKSDKLIYTQENQYQYSNILLFLCLYPEKNLFPHTRQVLVGKRHAALRDNTINLSN